MKQYLFEGYDPSLRDQLGPDAIVVTGRNFGLGSSREHVVQALKAWGVRAVVGKSFARIFRRNCVNLGLAIFEAPEAAEAAQPGSRIRIDTEAGEIVVDGRTFTTAAPWPSSSRSSRPPAGSSPGRTERADDDRPRPRRRLAGRPPDRPRRPLGGVRARVGDAARPVARRRDRAPRRRLGGLGAVAPVRRGRQAGQLPRGRRPLRTSRSTAPGSPRSPRRTRTPACSSRCTAPGSTGSATASTPSLGLTRAAEVQDEVDAFVAEQEAKFGGDPGERWRTTRCSSSSTASRSTSACATWSAARRPSCRATGSSRSRRGTSGCRRTRSGAAPPLLAAPTGGAEGWLRRRPRRGAPGDGDHDRVARANVVRLPADGTRASSGVCGPSPAHVGLGGAGTPQSSRIAAARTGEPYATSSRSGRPTNRNRCPSDVLQVVQVLVVRQPRSAHALCVGYSSVR